MGGWAGTDDNSRDSPGLELTGKIMVVAIIFLFFVIVVVCFLHLYAKWFWWNTEGSSTTTRRRSSRRRRRFVFAPGQDPAIYGVQRRGLDPEVLRSLPVLVYRPEDFKDGLECAVCLSEVAHGEKARILPKCNHGFHVECIDMWFQSHSTCPLCRNPVASESSESNNSSGVRGNTSDIYSPSSDSESSDSMSEVDLESANFPTNVLIWGNQIQVNSIGAGPSIEAPSSSSSAAADSCSSSNNNNRRNGMLVIDIPRETNPSSLPSTSRCADDELKSPMTSRLKSFKRMLSMKFSPRSPSSVDVEQAGRGQS
ncbi:RING-H2 finger protein ATL60-like [Neltuma alba]|uniref:RING-H2 finger protein ATL60-like n=1 Tax=Neltuma alba TaxID=207710 RepID=UPI0010A4A9A5|nr:RING-H2 finger protein ATL60-like [Prosopis alba]XP_028752223.1 RING-H2 finger protein ATL60-like [Prosopis alba]XP_028787369.1 RING-H2 finger protein ATL60-like [Prosopis alba]